MDNTESVEPQDTQYWYALGELSHSPLREWHLAISYSWAYHFIFTSFLYFPCRCFPSGMGDAHTSTVSAHTSLSSRRANYRSSAHGREQTSFIPRLLPGSSSNICFTFSDIGGEKIMYSILLCYSDLKELPSSHRIPCITKIQGISQTIPLIPHGNTQSVSPWH